MSTTYPPETNNRVVTLWTPLTASWTEVPGCSSKYMVYVDETDSSLVSESFSLGVSALTRTETSLATFIAYDAFWGISVRSETDLSCLPSEITSWMTQIPQEFAFEKYPDGRFVTLMSLLPLRCPDRWSTVATFVKSSISTQVMCCPENYYLSHVGAFYTGVEGVCLSTIDPDGVNQIEYAYRSKRYLMEYNFFESTRGSVSYLNLTTSTLKSKITAQAASIVGWNVQPTPSSTSTSILPVSARPFRSLDPITSQTDPSLASANDYRMSDSAKVGIGVSVGIGILIVIALIAWTVILTRRNRKLSAKIKISKKPQRSSRIDSNGVEIPSQTGELCASPSNELGDGSLGELGGAHINELNHHRSLRELDPITVSVEMGIATPKTPSAQRPGHSVV